MVKTFDQVFRRQKSFVKHIWLCMKLGMYGLPSVYGFQNVFYLETILPIKKENGLGGLEIRYLYEQIIASSKLFKT